MSKTRIIVGPIPEPNELVGREQFIANLWRQLDGNNVLLLAPRRFGKSGVMRHILLRPQNGFLPIYLNVEDVDSPEEFVWRITRALLLHDRWRAFLAKARHAPRKLQAWFQDTFDEIEFSDAKVTFKASVAEDWREVARRLLASLETAPERAIILLDELPSMLERLIEVQGEKPAKDFLGWFHTVRISQKENLRRHRFVVAGSIGVDQVLRKLGASDKLNDFIRLYVEPIARSDAEQLVAALAESIDSGITADLRGQIIDAIGLPVPYFIHLFFSELAQVPAQERRNPDSALIERVYRDRVQGKSCKRYFDHYRERLRRFGADGERAAMAILSQVATAPTGCVSESALFALYKNKRKRGWSEAEFTEVINDLECDWYLVRDPNTNEYYFLVKVMADWWRRWFARAPR
ncbi:MAG: hypothetical protein FJ399_17905 [Verrucomicrobia bacterium]|nr:hypothetical protein [Verrucomicrobiota bacterium]